jgi:hypothetical protein
MSSAVDLCLARRVRRGPGGSVDRAALDDEVPAFVNDLERSMSDGSNTAWFTSTTA